MIIGYTAINAQTNAEAPGVIAVENGIFVYGGGILPKNGYYLYERKSQDDSQYKEIAKTSLPQSEVEVEKKAAENATFFKRLQFLNKRDVKRVYEYTKANKTDDSIYRAEHTPIIALTIGTAFLDTNVETNKTYQYRVTLISEGEEIYKKELKRITNTIKTNLPKPKIHSADIVNDAVFLEWVVDHQEGLTFFNVYRAYFGTLDFKKITVKKGYSNDTDGLHLIAIDQTTEKSSLYKYYIEPVDLYGNAGDVSDIVSTGKLQAENMTPISSLHAEELEDYKVKITWQLNKSAIASNIHVFRSHRYDDGYVEVMNLPPNTSEFIDHLPEASENYYYYLVINGGTGQEFKSAKISAMVKTNSEELVGPEDLSWKSIQDGVELSWTYSEPYARGFYVFRSTSETKAFKQISNIIPVNGKDDYTFSDLDKNLKAGEMYRYVVRAENDAYTLGKFSDTIHAFAGKKPKIASPQKLKAVWRDSLVELVWSDMTEISEHVLGYKVYKSHGKNSPLQIMSNDSLNTNKNFYFDADVTAGDTYTYHVTSLDFFGQESALSLPSSITISKASENLFAPDKPIVYKSSKGTTISWHQIASDEISKVKIYRSEGNKNAKAITTLTIDNDSFLDDSVKKGALYYYKISFIMKSGKESPTSSEVSLYY